MKDLKSIVVGIDSSPACDQALKEAERIARWNESNLTAVNVLDERVLHNLNQPDAKTSSEITSEAEGGVKAHIEGVLGSDNLAKLEFIVGNPFTELQNTTAQHKAELLVLGSGHDSGHIGAVASKCVRRSHCDVLLVRESQKGGFRKVVACVDFSESSRQAVEEAFRVAIQDRAKLELLYVYPTIDKSAGSRFFFIPISQELLADNDEISTERSRKELVAFAEPFTEGAGGIDVSTVMLPATDHRRAILEYLNTSGADLVVMGKRGKTNLRAMLLGTTAERVINHAPCSVLLVNPGD